jgi:hypothetical protein
MTADIDRYRNNLRDEMNGAALYTALAAAEPVPQCLVLGGQAAGIRLPRGWSDLWSRSGVRSASTCSGADVVGMRTPSIRGDPPL